MSIHCYTLYSPMSSNNYDQSDQDPLKDFIFFDSDLDELTDVEIELESSNKTHKRSISLDSITSTASIPAPPAFHYSFFRLDTNTSPQFPLIDTVLSDGSSASTKSTPKTVKSSMETMMINYQTSNKEVTLDLYNRPRIRHAKQPRTNKGCYICRLRHLKCDGKRPDCARCTLINTICEYPEFSQPRPLYLTSFIHRKRKLEEIQRNRKCSGQ